MPESAKKAIVSRRASGLRRRPTTYFFAFEVGLYAWAFEKDLLLALQEGEAEKGRTEVARHTKEVAFGGAAAFYVLVGGHFTNGSAGDNESFLRSCRIAPHEVDPVVCAGCVNAFVEIVERLEGDAVADRKAKQDLRGGGVHGAEVAYVHNHRFVAQVFQRCVHEVEVDTFDQQVVCDHYLLAEMIEDCGVVADPDDRGRMVDLDIPGEVIDEAKFTERRYFCSFLHNASVHFKLAIADFRTCNAL
jgi:hypothetical protein